MSSRIFPAKMWENLPTEISNDILHRLGVKTLIKCTTLSKSFLSLITSPAFISTHIANHSNSHLVLRYVTEDIIENYHFELDDDNFSGFQTQGLRVPFHNYLNNIPLRSYFSKCFTIAGSINGVLCLVNEGTLIILWNPSIRKFVHVPRPIIESCRTDDVYKSFCGFGYDSISDDYKVVRIISRKTSVWEPPPTTIQPSQVEVYSLKSGCWRVIGDAPNYCFTPRYRGCIPCFINGSVYRVGFSIMDPRKGVIVKFDMCTERFEVIQLPGNLLENELTSIPIILYIHECKGNLTLIKGNYYDRLNTYSVWFMKEDGVVKSWTKTFDINMAELGPPRNTRAFGFRSNGEVIVVNGGHDIYFRDDDKSVVILIDQVTRSHTTLREISISCFEFNLFSYVESMVLFKEGKGIEEQNTHLDLF